MTSNLINHQSKGLRLEENFDKFMKDMKKIRKASKVKVTRSIKMMKKIDTNPIFEEVCTRLIPIELISI
jgi:hypothetical protein